MTLYVHVCNLSPLSSLSLSLSLPLPPSLPLSAPNRLSQCLQGNRKNLSLSLSLSLFLSLSLSQTLPSLCLCSQSEAKGSSGRPARLGLGARPPAWDLAVKEGEKNSIMSRALSAALLSAPVCPPVVRLCLSVCLPVVVCPFRLSQAFGARGGVCVCVRRAHVQCEVCVSTRACGVRVSAGVLSCW